MINKISKYHGLIRIFIIIFFGVWLSILEISILSWKFWTGLILFLAYGFVHVLGFTEEFLS